MWFIWNYFFGKPKIIQEPNVDLEISNTISRLRQSLIILESKEIEIQRDITHFHSQAKNSLKNKDKINATLFLQKVKLMETRLAETINTKFNIASQITLLENSSFTNKIVKDMENTRNTFRLVSNTQSPEHVSSLVNDINEEMQKLQSVNCIVGQNPVSSSVIDVSKELQELQEDINIQEQYEIDRKMLDFPSIPVRNSTENHIQPNYNTTQTSLQIENRVKEKNRTPRIISYHNGRVIDSLH